VVGVGVTAVFVQPVVDVHACEGGREGRREGGREGGRDVPKTPETSKLKAKSMLIIEETVP